MESAKLQPAAKLLPSRPASAPGGRCQLPGARFTSVPARWEAEIQLPPMRRRRSLFADKQQQQTPLSKVQRGPAGSTPFHRKRSNPHAASSPALATVVGSRAGHAQECQGDFCHAEIRYPASLQDLESSQHPWMKQARELCNRSLDDKHGTKLMLPVEMVRCLQLDEEEKESKCFAPGKAVSIPEEQQRPAARFGTPGFVNSSWICEARAYPSLCHWLQSEAGWLLNPQDPDQVAEAAAKMRKDEISEGHEKKKSRGGGRAPAFELDGCTPALQYRTRVVPVCGPCFCIHAAIHSALVMLRVHKRGLWARREKQRRLELEERERLEQLESFLQRERPPQPSRRSKVAVFSVEEQQL